MRKIPCPAPYREILAILVRAQSELLDCLDIARGCGAPTPDAEHTTLDQIARLARTTQLAAIVRGQDHTIAAQLPSAAVDAVEPDELYGGLLEACRILRSPSSMLPEGITMERLAEISDRTQAALAEVESAVDHASGI